MKKTLLAAALLAATSYATAASNVTLYGVLDAGVTVSKLPVSYTHLTLPTIA